MADEPKDHHRKAGGADWGWKIVAALLGGFITIIAATIQVCLTIPPETAQKNLSSWLVAGKVRSPSLPQITQTEAIMLIGTTFVIIGVMVSILFVLVSVRWHQQAARKAIFGQVHAKIDEARKSTGGEQVASAESLADAAKSNLGPIFNAEN